MMRRIVETLMPRWPLLNGETRAGVLDAASHYVSSSLARAPFHVRIGAIVLACPIWLVLVFLSVGAGGPGVRAARAESFYAFLQKVPGPFASAVRLYRSMTCLAFFEHPAVARLLDSETPAQRQSRFRALRAERLAVGNGGDNRAGG